MKQHPAKQEPKKELPPIKEKRPSLLHRLFRKEVKPAKAPEAKQESQPKKPEQAKSPDAKPENQQKKPEQAKSPEAKPKKHWFAKHDDKEASTVEQRAKQIEHGLQTKSLKKRRKRLQRKSLQEYLDKAGYDVPAQYVKRVMFRVIISLFAAFTLYVVIQAARWGANFLDVLGFILALWTAVFAAFLILGIGGVYFYLDYRIYKRTKEVEDVLPDFLQLTSSNIAAGMPIDRALWYSIRPNFGVLAKEMEEVAKATMSGEDLERSLLNFAEKYDSKLLQRSINILLEGFRSGGELADLLNKIALNIDEIKIMKKEMAANVTTYAIFIIVAAVFISPVLFALATQLLTIIVGITSTLDLSQSQSFFTLGAVDPDVIDNFMLFSYIMLFVSSMFGAAIVSVIRKGTVMEGIKAIPVYALIAIIMYRISLVVLGGAFGSIV